MSIKKFITNLDSLILGLYSFFALTFYGSPDKLIYIKILSSIFCVLVFFKFKFRKINNYFLSLILFSLSLILSSLFFQNSLIDVLLLNYLFFIFLSQVENPTLALSFFKKAAVLSSFYSIINRVIEDKKFVLLKESYRYENSGVGNPNDYSFVLGLATIIIFFELFKYFKLKLKLKFLLTFLLSLVLLNELFLFGGSRTAISAIVFSLFLVNFKFNKKSIITVAVIFFIGSLSISRIDFESNVLKRYLNSELKYDNSLNERTYLFTLSLEKLSENPFFGVGTNQFRFLDANYLKKYTHNNYLEIFANNGVLSFLLFYLPFYFLIKRLLFEKEFDNYFKRFLLNLILFMLIYDLGSVNYYNKMYLLTLGLIFVQFPNRLKSS